MIKLKKFLKGTGTKIFSILTAVLLLIPMLCAFTYPLTINITNPYDIPVDDYNFGGLEFGTNVINEGSYGYLNFTNQSIGDIVLPEGFSFGVTVRPPDYPDEIFKSSSVIVKGNIQGSFISPFNNIFYLSNADEVLSLIPTDNIVGVGLFIPPSFPVLSPCIVVKGGNSSTFTLKVSSTDVLREPLTEVYSFLSDGSATDDQINAEVEAMFANGIMILVLESEPTPTESITDVWTVIMNWITSALSTVQGVFLTGGSGQPYQLTLLGTLSVIGLSIALGFLIIGVIQRFLKFRG